MFDAIKARLMRFARGAYTFCFVRDYVRKVPNARGRVFVSYLSEPFFRRDDRKYMAHHQNRQETLVMAEVFAELGYSSHFRRLDKPMLRVPRCDVVFGVEPNFVRVAASPKNRGALKIYYATGSYWEYQNRNIRRRTDELNRRLGTKLPYRRLVPEHDACRIADRIFQIGTPFTVESYPEELRGKIRLLEQSSLDVGTAPSPEEKLRIGRKNAFLWMGSKGSVLKGLDLVIEYFSAHPELECHCFGEVEPDLMRAYREKLDASPNIVIHGYVDIRDAAVRRCIDGARFVLLPSASEGVPGAVINMMKLGLIPVVSRVAAVAGDMAAHGIMLEDLNVEFLARGIDAALALDDATLKKLIGANQEWCRRFSLENFGKNLYALMKSALDGHEHDER